MFICHLHLFFYKMLFVNFAHFYIMLLVNFLLICYVMSLDRKKRSYLTYVLEVISLIFAFHLVCGVFTYSNVKCLCNQMY